MAPSFLYSINYTEGLAILLHVIIALLCIIGSVCFKFILSVIFTTLLSKCKLHNLVNFSFKSQIENSSSSSLYHPYYSAFLSFSSWSTCNVSVAYDCVMVFMQLWHWQLGPTQLYSYMTDFYIYSWQRKIDHVYCKESIAANHKLF